MDGRRSSNQNPSRGIAGNASFVWSPKRAKPRNRLGIARVDVFYPTAILSQGIVLIDALGVGSTLRHQTDAAHEVLPECDVGLFVLSADPPVTEAELAYLERVRPTVGRLFFVLNKNLRAKSADLKSTLFQ